ncbi:MAG: glycosyltransferase [Sphingobacteriaceae bacterium]|jgi:glycosyltransferase involved in cell wall biosynthesis|nr:glycosyltransferase [Sphingobacteriaceae bacterium]
MLRGKTIFILGTAKFDAPYQSTSFTIAQHLAKDNTVYYVDYPFTWKDYFKYKGTAEFKIRQPYFPSSSDGIMPTKTPGLSIVITPPLLPINFLPEGQLYRKLLKWNEGLIVKRIEKVLKSRQISDYIYINSFNFHYPDIADKLNPVLTVYHCVDPLIVDYDKKHGQISEAKLVKNSDLVVCTSKQLYEEKKPLNPATYFIPNAADITHSSKALDPALPVHASLANIPKPLIGYFGNIERRIDFDLLKEVITNNTDKSFVFAGPTVPEYIPEWFFNTPNIHLTGRLPYSEMPAMIKGFDVAMIPFKKDEVSRTIFPLKLFEYLGAGKPVVATDFNLDLVDFTYDIVLYCSDAKSFSEAIRNALKEAEMMIGKRVEIAKENTWDKRAAEFSALLESNLAKSKK